jgi:hypothetical protein
VRQVDQQVVEYGHFVDLEANPLANPALAVSTTAAFGPPRFKGDPEKCVEEGSLLANDWPMAARRAGYYGPT